MPQTKILTARSNFSTPIKILSIKSKDPRIEAKIVNREIKPWNMSISGMVTFDAGKTGTEKQSEYIKFISQFSIENPPTIQIDLGALNKGKSDKPVHNFVKNNDCLLNLQLLNILNQSCSNNRQSSCNLMDKALRFFNSSDQGSQGPDKAKLFGTNLNQLDICSKFPDLSDIEITSLIQNLEADQAGQSALYGSIASAESLKDFSIPLHNNSSFNIPLRDTFGFPK